MSYQIPAVFQNDSNYDCHFIMKELVKLFDGKFQCFGEYTEKSKTFSVPIEKEIFHQKKMTRKNLRKIM